MTRQVTIVTPENAEISYELAGLGSRMVACIIDTLIQGLIAVAIAIPFALAGIFGMISGGTLSHLSGWATALTVIGLFLLMWGYYLGYEATKNGQTFGKRVVRIRVVRDSGQPIDFACAAVRNLVRWVDFLPGGYSVGVLSILLSPTYRRLGDYAAGTMVVRERLSEPQTPQEQATLVQRDGFDGDVSGLSKDDHEAIHRFVDRRRELEPALQADLARRMSIPILDKLDIEAHETFNYVEFLESVHLRLVEDRQCGTAADGSTWAGPDDEEVI